MADPFDLNRDNHRFQNTFSGVDIKVIAYLQLSREQRKKALDAFNSISDFEEQARLAKERAFNDMRKAKRELETFPQLVGGVPLTDDETLRQISQSFQTEQDVKNADAARINADAARETFREVIYDLGNLTTLSYSMFREKFAVRPLGTTQAKSYTRGPRTIAGSMIFTVFNHFSLDNMIDVLNQGSTNKINLLDQLPPFNVMMIFSNEYGQSSILHLFDLQFTSEGQTQSIHDDMIDRTLNWYCEDMLPLRPIQRSFTSYSDMFIAEVANIQEQQDDRRAFGSFDNDLRPIRFEDILKQAQGNQDDPGNAKINELIQRGRRTTV